MQMIDIIGIILIVVVLGWGIYKIFGIKKSGGGCGCGGGGKCSKPKHYSSDKKEI
ncbi:FeoB-associated Cys-rich membrane protein [Helicobacter sp. 11S03491-1]|uniref:FeoB-associated Cys-rich membrane protein n=1 Tax=Helicobacter sp. 11S03491-1 TaxID=1476196 RepID=UPI001C5FE598|nr:FeoB-associated Cys-rich membrane protein [Helicobacter sp. 11S03491-1]